MTVKKYRVKTATIQALQYTGNNFQELRDFAGEDFWINPNEIMYLTTSSGHIRVFKYDYIIKGVDGSFSVCGKTMFLKAYEEVPE